MRAAIARGASYAKRVLRVTTYVVLVTIALGVLVAARARAALGDAALALGGELAEMGPALGPANRVRLNGERVDVASAMVDESPEAVLDRFEAECRAHAGGLVEEMERLAKSANEGRGTPSPRGEGEGPPAIGVLRRNGDHRGAVACLAQRGDAGSAGFLRGLHAMLASGDLAALGELRYVLAERTPGATRTHVVAAWTRGSFQLRSLFPHGGADAPGSDPRGAPRPDGSRRLLTASLESAPYGVRVYDAPGAPADVLASYDRAMASAGWSPVAGVGEGLARAGRPGRAYEREGVDLFVFADTDRRDAGRSVVSVLDVPPPSK